ncbi:hypothetical protein IIB79_08480 [candidate division KSB1 bacterium]|nr:hypothetical protein [candidate division KSB1 bacterium]
MSVIDFDKLPGSARLWIFGSTKPVGGEQIDFIKNSMDRFVKQWVAHKRELTAGWDLKYNRFFFLAVDESDTDVSGCSIDSMVHNLKEIEKETGYGIVNSHSKVFYRDKDGGIQCVERDEFKQLAENAVIDENTVVFNNTIQSLSELKEGKWEVPMSESWHGKIFIPAVQNTH